MGLAVAFTGPSNSGKTTLIEKVAQKLLPKYKVVVIKHDPKDKASFDKEGKDSWRFFQTGADVVVASPTKTTYFSHAQRNLDEIVRMVGEFDFLLVEGLKTWPLPRIAVFRGSIDESYLDVSDAVAVDESVDRAALPRDLEILDLNDPDQVVRWILKNAQKV